MIDFLIFINYLIWDSILTYLLIGAGIWLTYRCGFIQFRYFSQIRFILRKSPFPNAPGISSFQALCTSLAARAGSGNLAGVALAIAAGGPGAIFWMWVIALLGMAISFAECSLAQLYKSRDSEGNFRGGPAWYMEQGLGMRWMAVMFSIILVLTFGLVFNIVQAHSISTALQYAFDIPKVWTGIILAVLTAIATRGGMRRAAHLSQWLIPLITLFWVAISFYVVALNIQKAPEVIMLVFRHAFGWHEAASGALGYTLSQAITSGFQRGMFSNQAGMGSTPNAAAAAWHLHPATQGIVQMFGVLIDTIIICTATAAIVLMSGVPGNAQNGIIMVQQALSSIVGSWGSGFIAVLVSLFAFASIVANYAYAENNLLFLKKKRPFSTAVFRCMVSAMVISGTLIKLPLAWHIASMAMALMAITNITAILLLSPVVRNIAGDYLRQHKLGVTPVFDVNRFPEIKSQLTPGVWDKTEPK